MSRATPLTATPMTPLIRIDHPTRQACLTGFDPLRHDLQSQLVQACERGRIRTNEGTVQHFEVFPRGCARTPSIGRPQPSPQDHHTSHAHTRPTPCFVMSREPWERRLCWEGCRRNPGAELEPSRAYPEHWSPRAPDKSRWGTKWKPALNAFVITFTYRTPRQKTTETKTPLTPLAGQSRYSRGSSLIATRQLSLGSEAEATDKYLSRAGRGSTSPCHFQLNQAPNTVAVLPQASEK